MAPAKISDAEALNRSIKTPKGPSQAIDSSSSSLTSTLFLRSRTCTTGPDLMNNPVRLMASGREPPPLLLKSRTTASTFSLFKVSNNSLTSRVVLL